jgi:dihydroorotate dehydrogenase electron transfer subunit
MSNPLHASYYADRAIQRTVSVVENVPLAQHIRRLRVECADIARVIVPGQFVMLRISGCDDPLIGRPLAVYDTVLDAAGDPRGLDVVYLVKGKFTRRVADFQAGQELDIWGPLGNGFAAPTVEHLVLVAGGIGQTPFVAVAHEALGARRYGSPPRPSSPCRRVTLCYGARTADLLAGVEDFEALGVEVRLATEDGSRGHQGLVTEVLDELLQEASPSRHIYCCGPEPLLRATTRLATATETPCDVSLETPMACGIGICFSCVARIKDGTGGWDYKRTCVEGPVFDAGRIAW